MVNAEQAKQTRNETIDHIFETLRQHFSKYRYQYGLVAVLIGGLTGLVALLSLPSDAWCCGRLVLVSAASLAVGSLFMKNRILWCVGCTAFLAFVFSRASYTTPWSSGNNHYVDSHWFCTGQIYHRRFSCSRNGYSYHAEGGMAGTGKMHGHWRSSTYDASREDLCERFRSVDEFFWYGKPVTEGEFHDKAK